MAEYILIYHLTAGDCRHYHEHNYRNKANRYECEYRIRNNENRREEIFFILEFRDDGEDQCANRRERNCHEEKRQQEKISKHILSRLVPCRQSVYV